MGLLALLVAASAVGVWNPWHYVLLRQHLGNPLADGAAVTLVFAAAIWLLVPVHSEAAQHGRVLLRWAAVVAFLATLACFGGFGSAFDRGQIQTVARSGGLRLVVETRGEDAEIRIWAGKGWAVRDMGRVGRACGEVSGSFPSRSEVQITTVYGDFRISLDPDTGRPLRQLGPTCSG